MAKRRLIVRLVRRIRGEDTFDIDPAISMSDLFAFVARRLMMATRGIVLSLRTGRFVAPVFVGRRVSVHNARHLRLSAGVTIEDDCRLDCLGVEGVHLGRGCTLRRGVHIEVTSVLRKIGAGCRIGDRVGVSEGCYIGAKGSVTIGADTIIGPGTIILSEEHVCASIDVPIRAQGVTRKGVAIGSDCWLGAGVRLLDGASIGDGAVVGAGAVVTRDVPRAAVAVGIPARVKRFRSDSPTTLDASAG